MDKNVTKVKNDSLCYQILFNKPLCVSKHKYIYGFRLKVDELKRNPLSEKLLLEYIVEQIFGKCLFQEIHNGDFGGYKENIWIDRGGNEYICGDQTRLYSYDATVENMMNYRCDLLYANCENEKGDNYWIIDADEYFECKAKADADDHKSGKNQWMENFYKIKSRRELQSMITVNISKNLDYHIQELINGEWFNGKDNNVDVQNIDDELPF